MDNAIWASPSWPTESKAFDISLTAALFVFIPACQFVPSRIDTLRTRESLRSLHHIHHMQTHSNENTIFKNCPPNPFSGQCWYTVYDADPALTQLWDNNSCLLDECSFLFVNKVKIIIYLLQLFIRQQTTFSKWINETSLFIWEQFVP